MKPRARVPLAGLALVGGISLTWLLATPFGDRARGSAASVILLLPSLAGVGLAVFLLAARRSEVTGGPACRQPEAESESGAAKMDRRWSTPLIMVGAPLILLLFAAVAMMIASRYFWNGPG